MIPEKESELADEQAGERVERAAQAVYDEMQNIAHGIVEGGFIRSFWNELESEGRENCRRLARAALRTPPADRNAVLEEADIEQVARIIAPELWGSPFAYPEGIHSDDTLIRARDVARAKATAIRSLKSPAPVADDGEANGAGVLSNHTGGEGA